jgi:hypothetical protein
MTNLRPFLHIHIRKTAGTSLRTLLTNQFPVDRLFLNAHSVRGPQEPGEASFVTGHVAFDYVQRFSVRPTIFTVFREPISHALSTYFFFRTNDEEFFQTIGRDWNEADLAARRRFTERARALDMLSFLRAEESLAKQWLSNPQTRQLASCAHAERDNNRVLETAIANLRTCDLVGTLERLDETLFVVGHHMRWGAVGPLQHLNATRAEAVDRRCLEILRAWNPLDLQLYGAASALLDKKLELISKQPLAEVIPDPQMLPSAEDFTPDMPIRGYGWHEREHHDGRWLCWTASETATLQLAVRNSGATRFRCLVSHAIGPDAVATLRMSLNSCALTINRRRIDQGWLIESALPRGAMEETPGLASIAIDCPVMARPCNLNASSTDRRKLGVAVARIAID